MARAEVQNATPSSGLLHKDRHLPFIIVSRGPAARSLCVSRVEAYNGEMRPIARKCG